MNDARTEPGSRTKAGRLVGGLRWAVSAVVVVAVAGWLIGPTLRRYELLPEPAGRVSLRFSHFGNYQDYELWRSVLADFERTHPDVRVRQEYVVGFSGRYTTKLRQQIATDTCPDVVLIQLAGFVELAEHFEPIDPVPDDLDPVGRACFQASGVQRGLPVSGGPLLIYINPSCFLRANHLLAWADFDRSKAVARREPVVVPVPTEDWTLADFQRAAEQTTCDLDGDGQLDQFGFWQPRWVYYLPFIWSFGADVVDVEAGEWRFVGPAAERAVAFYHELCVSRPVCPRPDEVPQLWQDTGFLTGRVAMCVNGPWFMPFLDQTKLARDYDVLPVPSGPGGRVTRVTWDGVVIAKDLPAERAEAAQALVTHLLSPAVQERIARMGRALPARRSAWLAFVGDDMFSWRRQRFVDAMAHARTQPRTVHFTPIDRLLNRSLGRLLTDDQPDIAGWLAAIARSPEVMDHFTVPALAAPAASEGGQP